MTSRVFIQKLHLLRAYFWNGLVACLEEIFFFDCESELNLKIDETEIWTEVTTLDRMLTSAVELVGECAGRPMKSCPDTDNKDKEDHKEVKRLT